MYYISITSQAEAYITSHSITVESSFIIENRTQSTSNTDGDDNDGWYNRL